MNNMFENIIKIVYLAPENATFYKAGDFLALKTNIDGEEKDHGIVKLRRLFPFEELWRDISVLTPGNEEIGVIRDVALFGETETLLRSELTRVYFTPKIQKILSMKEKYGFSNWDVETDIGKITFSVRDTFRSVHSFESGRVIITDVDGSRYEIIDANKLDKASYRKIEIYL